MVFSTKHEGRLSLFESLTRLCANWLMHAWNTTALPFTVATLSSVFKFLMNVDLLTKLWPRASSAKILIFSLASYPDRLWVSYARVACVYPDVPATLAV